MRLVTVALAVTILGCASSATDATSGLAVEYDLQSYNGKQLPAASGVRIVAISPSGVGGYSCDVQIAGGQMLFSGGTAQQLMQMRWVCDDPKRDTTYTQTETGTV